MTALMISMTAMTAPFTLFSMERVQINLFGQINACCLTVKTTRFTVV
jgi:hypothetical protein